MNTLRVILLMLALLPQALTAGLPLAQWEHAPACRMACCAAFDDDGTGHCGCVSETDAPVPAPLPPPSPQREGFPPPVTISDEAGLPRPYSRTAASVMPARVAPSLLTTPHVRLPVLHGALLH